MLDTVVLKGQLARPTTDDYVGLIQPKGICNELAYLEQLKATGILVVEISDRGTLDDSLEATRKVLIGGPDIFYPAAQAPVTY